MAAAPRMAADGGKLATGGLPATGGSPATGSASIATSGATGLPCDVLSLVQTKCVACHSSPPVGGAPMPMETYADLTAPAKTDPSKTVAQMSMARLQSTTAPMPPAGSPPATVQEVAAFQAWVAAGTPTGTCSDADAAAAASPYDTPVQCSSGVTSTRSEGPTMRPGDTCVSCHARSGGQAPLFTIGGTVYKTAHEPTNCEGINLAGATVVITDANNTTFTLPVNAAGNFYSSQRVAVPFYAKVVYGGASRAMAAAQTSGDCNSCHTESGASGAPGRIMLP